jgi:hypothetical protein
MDAHALNLPLNPPHYLDAYNCGNADIYTLVIKGKAIVIKISPYCARKT